MCTISPYFEAYDILNIICEDNVKKIHNKIIEICDIFEYVLSSFSPLTTTRVNDGEYMNMYLINIRKTPEDFSIIFDVFRYVDICKDIKNPITNFVKKLKKRIEKAEL